MQKKWVFGMIFLVLLIIGAGITAFCGESESGRADAGDQRIYKVRKLFPADEGEQDDDFSAFRLELIEAVKKRDVRFISDILAPNVVVSPPDADGVVQDFGVRAFMKKWHPENEFSPLWDRLSVILSLGGMFAEEDRTQFAAPYVHSLWPGDVDSTRYWAVVGESINVREQPGLNAAVIASRSYEILRVNGRQTGKWIGVTLPDGRRGFVFGEFIRGKDDYSIGFEKVGDRWMIKWFVGKERSKTFPPAEP